MLTVPAWSFTFNTLFFGEEEVGYENIEVAKLDLSFKNIQMPKEVLELIVDNIETNGRSCTYNKISLMYECDCAATAEDTCIQD